MTGKGKPIFPPQIWHRLPYKLNESLHSEKSASSHLRHQHSLAQFWTVTSLNYDSFMWPSIVVTSLITCWAGEMLTTCRRSDIFARMSLLRALRSGWLRRNLTLSSMSLRRVRIIICWNTCLLSTHTLALVTTVDREAGNYLLSHTFWDYTSCG